jgi:hypothetical protein
MESKRITIIRGLRDSGKTTKQLELIEQQDPDISIIWVTPDFDDVPVPELLLSRGNLKAYGLDWSNLDMGIMLYVSYMEKRLLADSNPKPLYMAIDEIDLVYSVLTKNDFSWKGFIRNIQPSTLEVANAYVCFTTQAITEEAYLWFIKILPRDLIDTITLETVNNE